MRMVAGMGVVVRAKAMAIGQTPSSAVCSLSVLLFPRPVLQLPSLLSIRLCCVPSAGLFAVPTVWKILPEISSGPVSAQGYLLKEDPTDRSR